ncbi:DUF1295 domain-containing protein [Aurantiacibacter rhizosphaerae]|uniref:DUF1295 domain-containing protein n=1 Tax=Aurantiacibacter rhizosphaerae TaxID=2691582 RepID=A0A844XAE3_9SPHN|nr:DUF1295 domain-containing protein [Aurantiacibacter rhizosphaerae]MWV26608.1 DUF1295 domain-containing protein [Aurantiacibacter rhizosphaerae]
MAEALALNALALLAAVLALWVLSVALGKVSFVDSVWGLAMAGLALLSWWQADARDLSATILMAMVLAWGVRLGVHLLRRFLRNGEDKRYTKMLPSPDDRGAFALTALWKVWLLQAALIMLVSSPAQVGILAASGAGAIGPLAWMGMALYCTGIFFEWVGDWQLARFKADPANQGKVMNTGLWRYTRHPNYFGDACAWWGIFAVALSIDFGAVIWTLPGPLFLTFTLVKWSGAAMTEDAMRDKYGEDFARYTRRTSAFIPLPPAAA